MPKLAIKGGTPVRTREFPQWPIYDNAEEQQLKEVLYKTKWGIGKRVGKIQEFEERFAAYHGCRHGVACTNCSHALQIMLAVCGVGAGDEVIVPSYTFIATASAVTQVGAIPVFADIELNTYAIDPDDVERRITGRTRAIIPVHFAGHFADMERITQIAREHDLIVVEDAAQAHGGKWNGQCAGKFGIGAGFSFQYSKNMTAGEGGIIITNDEEFANDCWEYVWHGRKKGGIWYEHFRASSNFRITEWQAAVLIAQLGRLEEQTQIRQRNAAYLDAHLAEIEGVETTHVDRRMQIHPRHLYIIRFQEEHFEGVPKEKILKALVAEGIPALPGYGFPLYRNPAFRKHNYGCNRCQHNKIVNGEEIDYTTVHNPNAERACRESVWLVHNVLLGTQEDMGDIVRAVEKVVENRAELRDIE